MTGIIFSASPDLRIEDISPARLHGEACFLCGSADPPLSHAGSVALRGRTADVVHDFDVALCASCWRRREPASGHRWAPGRYEPSEMPPDTRGIIMWGITDAIRGGAWVEGLLDEKGNEGPLPFPSKDSATSWIRSIRYLTEGPGGQL